MRDVMRFVHGHPELAYEEGECSRYLGEVLGRAGFEAVGSDGGVEPVHSCGHGPIAGGVAAAGAALADLRDRLS